MPRLISKRHELGKSLENNSTKELDTDHKENYKNMFRINVIFNHIIVLYAHQPKW